MEKAFHAKAQEVLSGKTTILATSSDRDKLHSLLTLGMTPGQDTLLRTGQNAALGFGTGLTWGAITVAWHPENPVDKRGKYVDVFTLRAVGTVVLQPAVFLGLVMGAFTFGQCQFETYRNTRDPWNSVYSGAIVGFIANYAVRKRVDKAIFTAFFYGLGMGLADIAGPLLDYNGNKGGLPMVRQKTYVESDELRDLKELYPKYKDL